LLFFDVRSGPLKTTIISELLSDVEIKYEGLNTDRAVGNYLVDI